MKHLKRFNENNNSELIQKLKEYGIENYTINSDGTIDVDGNVNLHDRGLTQIPFNFRNVTGYFHCGSNLLTSLKGCPKDVGEYFYCTYNKLKNLIGGPQLVYGDYWCNYNELETLEGCAGDIKGGFNCSCNKLTDLDCSSVIEGDIECRGNGFLEEPYFYGFVGKKIIWK